MAKSDVGNNGTENNSPEDKLKRIEALAEKLSKTDMAFGARFQELMKFSVSISSTEQKLKSYGEVNKEEFERMDKRLKLCEKVISVLSTKAQTLEKTIGEHKERVDEYIKRIDTPLEHISREQTTLLHRFSLIDKALNQENKLQKEVIWVYRAVLAVTVIFFVYYHFSRTKDINAINNKLNNLSEKALYNKEIDAQAISDNKDNKSKINKK